MNHDGNPKPEANKPEAWHLDKRVPIALIAAVVGQTAVAGWAMSKFDSRLATLEEKLAREEASTKDSERESKDILSRMVRVEVQTGAILEGLRRLETRLDTAARRIEYGIANGRPPVDDRVPPR